MKLTHFTPSTYPVFCINYISRKLEKEIHIKTLYIGQNKILKNIQLTSYSREKKNEKMKEQTI